LGAVPFETRSENNGFQPYYLFCCAANDYHHYYHVPDDRAVIAGCFSAEALLSTDYQPENLKRGASQPHAFLLLCAIMAGCITSQSMSIVEERKLCPEHVVSR
jgi:hypothetical protein